MVNGVQQPLRKSSAEISRLTWSHTINADGSVSYDPTLIVVGAVQRIADAVEGIRWTAPPKPPTANEIAAAVKAALTPVPAASPRAVRERRERLSRLRAQRAYIRAGGVVEPEDMEPEDGCDLTPGTVIAGVRPLVSVRLRKAIARLGITTLSDLAKKTADELLEHRNFGMTSLVEARLLLARAGLRLAGE